MISGRTRSRVVLLVVLAVLISGCATANNTLQLAAAHNSAEWLETTHQNDDGGYSSFSSGANQAPSDPAGTVDALLALAAARRHTEPALDYLEANDEALWDYASENGAQAGKVVLALSAARANPQGFAGHDFAELLRPSGEDGAAPGVDNAYGQSLAILGRAAVGARGQETPAAWLESRQAANGSWDDGFGTVDNPDATALAIMALLAAGRSIDSPSVVAAADFLASAQAVEGGWAYGAGLPVSVNSTALVIQAINALGEDPTRGDGRWARDGRSPLATLLSFVGDSGAFQADFGDGPVDDFFSTVQAIPAVAGETLPIEPVR